MEPSTTTADAPQPRALSRAPAVQARGLSRSYGGRRVVNDVSLTLQAGDCLALFGPNGAGKSTVLRMLAGLLKPEEGSVAVGGVDVRGDAAARAAVGLVSHANMLYAPLTALENVAFTARLYGVPQPREAALRAMQAMAVADRAHSPVRALSRGLQQRVAIARATVHAPHLVLLDEPYSGLDEPGSQALTRLLGSLRAHGAAMVLVTHNVLEGLALATHAAIMSAGRFVRFEHREAGGTDPHQYLSEYRELAGHA